MSAEPKSSVEPGRDPRLTSYARDGLVFDVHDSGPLDGDPVVLLHGFPQRASSWDAVVPLLHAAGLRTYAPDQRGYSPGARPRRRRDHRTTELADDVATLLREIGRPVHLVGHDWGSVVGWVVAAQHPELVRSWTAVSVGHPVAFLRSLLTSNQLRMSWYMAFFWLPRLPERVLATARGETELRRGGMSPAMIERYRREVVADGALRGGLSWYRGLLLTNVRRAFRRVRVPTTMIWSSGDVALGRTGAVGSRRWVSAPYAYVELPGVSHWVPEEAPQAVADAVLARV